MSIATPGMATITFGVVFDANTLQRLNGVRSRSLTLVSRKGELQY